MKNKYIFILCLLNLFLGTFIGYKIFYQPIIIPVVEYKDRIITIKDTIEVIQKSIDTLYIQKNKLVIKEKLINNKRNEENTNIISTSDSNIIKLFSELSIKLSSTTRIK